MKNIIYEVYPCFVDNPYYGDQRNILQYQGQVFKAPKSYGICEMGHDLKNIRKTGANYLYLAGALESPRLDHGFDVSDYRQIHHEICTMSDPHEFGAFVYRVHKNGMKLIIDLVLNHCSTEHPWFKFYRNQRYFCWSDEPKYGWENLFDFGSAWEFDLHERKYYLHMFHPGQADFAWFDASDRLNDELVDEFRDIVRFWLKLGVDGFRLDMPQAINKDLNAKSCTFGDMLYGEKSIAVINAIFKGFDCTLMMEYYDNPLKDEPSVLDMYTSRTPVKFGENICIKGLEWDAMMKGIAHEAQNPAFVCSLQSHDSCRFPSRPGMDFMKELEALFASAAQNILIFHGEELGLTNSKLTDDEICALDAQAAMRRKRGCPFKNVRILSRAHNRIPVPVGEFERQLESEDDDVPLKQFLKAKDIWLAV